MRFQATRLWPPRCEIGLAIALAAVTAVLLAVLPITALVALLELRSGRRLHRTLLFEVVRTLGAAIRWLWLELHGLPHRPWYPCAQCGRPIEKPSRALYCSPGCRRWALLKRRASGGDERAMIQLRRLERDLRVAASYGEVPF